MPNIKSRCFWRTTINTLQAAIYYASLGWRVLPCRPRDKRPATAHGVKDVTTDPAKINEWWARQPAYNVAVACGSVSRILVVDCDGLEGLGQWEAFDHDKPATLRINTPGGGAHFYYLLAAGQVAPSRKLASKIDLRGEGVYVVAPPSIGANGRPYSGDGADVADCPAWLLSGSTERGNLAGLYDPSARPLGERGERPEAYERAAAYLACLSPAVSGAGGHNQTFRAASELFRFGLTESEAWDLLCQFNLRCVPPWSEKELRHKLKSAKESVDKDHRFGEHLEKESASTTTDADRGRQYPAESHDRTLPQGGAAAFGRDATPAGGGEAAAALPDTISAALSENAAVGSGATDVYSPAGEAGFPFDAAAIGFGAFGDSVRYALGTAFKRQAELTLANMIAMWGAVLGQLVMTESGLRTNVYLLGVGDSGCGKDHSRAMTKKILAAANATHLLGGEDIGSDSAIEQMLLQSAGGYPSCICLLDEMGHMLSLQKSFNAAAYQSQIPTMLTKMFSSANSLYIGKQLVNRDRAVINQPCLSLYGSTVPGRFYGALKSGDIGDGFLSRMVIVESPDPDPPENSVAPTDVPTNISDAIIAWRKLASTAFPNPVAIKTTPDAQRVFADFSAYSRKKRAGHRDGSGIDTLWVRSLEHANKLALIFSCAGGDPLDLPSIRIDHTAAWTAVEMVRHCAERFARNIQRHVADGEYGKTKLAICEAVRRAGCGGLTRSALLRRFRGVRSKDLSEMLSALVETDDISSAVRGTATKPISFYLAR